MCSNITNVKLSSEKILIIYKDELFISVIIQTALKARLTICYRTNGPDWSSVSVAKYDDHWHKNDCMLLHICPVTGKNCMVRQIDLYCELPVWFFKHSAPKYYVTKHNSRCAVKPRNLPSHVIVWTCAYYSSSKLLRLLATGSFNMRFSELID